MTAVVTAHFPKPKIGRAWIDDDLYVDWEIYIDLVAMYMAALDPPSICFDHHCPCVWKLHRKTVRLFFLEAQSVSLTCALCGCEPSMFDVMGADAGRFV